LVWGFFIGKQSQKLRFAKSMEDAGSIEKNMSPLQRFFFEFFLNKNKNTYFLCGGDFFFLLDF